MNRSASVHIPALDDGRKMVGRMPSGQMIRPEQPERETLLPL
ncbi:hypothetical protein [Rhizobium sp. AC44/96]|jgi:hypothetical protein|nr:hypothetical protein [Rhizobium sp. AC44/96]